MKLKLENGKTIEIDAPSNNRDNRYVNNLKLNGKDLDRNYVTHDEIDQWRIIQI